MCILSVLPLYAQNRAASPDRIAVVDISDTTLNQVRYNAMAAALANTCSDELGLETVSATSLASYLKKHPSFSVFEAGQVQALCRALSVEYLIIALLEKLPPAAKKSAALSGDRWRCTLRWMDGSSGQMTKIHAQECLGNIGAPETFPLHALLKGLLEAPSIILAVDNGLTDMPPAIWPSPMNLPSADSSATIEAADLPSYQKRGGRHWLWYVTGAAVISGGSAVLLLRNQDRPPAARTILPEPPDPPQ